MTPPETRCSRKYHAVRSSGQRDVDTVIWIVLHDEEAPTAESAAQWFENPKAQGSAHLCVDDNECFRTLDNDEIPWGAPGANEQGFHIEQAGFAKWSSVVWLSHYRTLQRAAYKTALHCYVFGIPTTFIGAAGLRAGRKGITTHAEVSKAFGGTHTDPGPFWPRRLFMRFVRSYYQAHQQT